MCQRMPHGEDGILGKAGDGDAGDDVELSSRMGITVAILVGASKEPLLILC